MFHNRKAKGFISPELFSQSILDKLWKNLILARDLGLWQDYNESMKHFSFFFLKKYQTPFV
jgi:hypothetical protein